MQAHLEGPAQAASPRDDAPAPTPTAESTLHPWRSDVASKIFSAVSLLGMLMLALYAPELLRSRSYVLLGAYGALWALTFWLKDPASSRVEVRGWYLTLLLLSGAVPGLIASGDRGVSATLLVGACFVASMMLSGRAALGVFALELALLAVIAWGYARGLLPLERFIGTDWNSPAGWLGLAVTLVLIGAIAYVFTAELAAHLRALLAAHQEAIRTRDEAIAELTAEQSARVALSSALADTLNAVRGGFWEMSLSTGETAWSEGLYRLLDYEPGAVTPGDPAWRARLAPEDYDALLAQPLAPNITTEYRVLLSSGTRWLRNAMQTLYDEAGRPARLRGITLDVTDEHEAADRLALLAEVANRTVNAVVVTDLDGGITWVNDAFERLTGWTSPEVVGRRPGSFLQGPHTSQAVVTEMRDAVAARCPFDVEILNYARDGRQYWVRIQAHVARDPRGEPVGFVALETDVTAQRIAASQRSLTQRIAAVLLTCDSLAQAGEAVTQALVRELDIVSAQLWRVEPGVEHLVYVTGAAAAETGEAGARFLSASRAIEFRAGELFVRGVGIPGVAWGTRRTVIQPKLRRDEAFETRSRRLEAADGLGVETFVAAPILGQDGVVGVLEIGGRADYPGHDLLPELLERVAEMLASFSRHDTTRRAFETIFNRSPDALLIVDEDGRVRSVNERAAVLFGPRCEGSLDAMLDGAEALVRQTLAGEEAASSTLHTLEAKGRSEPFSAEVSIARWTSSTRRGAILAVRDLTERHRMEAALSQSLREKETLLREVHHRVKNNLQVVSSMLSIQASELGPESAAALREAEHRVRSMSYVHQILYGTDRYDAVDLASYTRTLCQSLRGALDPTTTLTLTSEPVAIPIDRAVPCGLILNELLTNAFKHGRSADGRCALAVDVRPVDGNVFIRVADEGPGLAPDPKRGGTIGMTILRSLTRSLRAELKFECDRGTAATLTFPLVVPPGGVSVRPSQRAT